MGSLRQGISIAAEYIARMVVREDEQKIWLPASRYGLGSHSGYQAAASYEICAQKDTCSDIWMTLAPDAEVSWP